MFQVIVTSVFSEISGMKLKRKTSFILMELLRTTAKYIEIWAKLRSNTQDVSHFRSQSGHRKLPQVGGMPLAGERETSGTFFGKIRPLDK